LFDIVAINGQGIRLIQVKTNRDASPLEREAMSACRQAAGECDEGVWIFLDYAREPVIKAIG